MPNIVDISTMLIETWGVAETVFSILFALSALILLYIITFLHQSLRLIQHELQNCRKDIAVMSEEMELLAQAHGQGRNATEILR